MQTIKKNVYYCDFCGKHNLSASSISKHEKHCTANPNRECRLCEGREIASFIEGLKKRFKIIEIPDNEYPDLVNQEIKWKGEKITLDEILDYTEGCPNCTLAILRQTKLNYQIFGFNYNYQKELAEWWKEIANEEWERERREMAGMY